VEPSQKEYSDWSERIVKIQMQGEGDGMTNLNLLQRLFGCHSEFRTNEIRVCAQQMAFLHAGAILIVRPCVINWR